MLTYHINSKGILPMYEQLYRSIREDIINGVIKGGEKLPSKRRLAEHLKISQITVENAYSQLLAEGYIISKPRSGYYAQQIIKHNKKTELINYEIPKPKAENYLYAFHTNTVDTECFPFSSWAKLLRSELTEKASKLLIAAPNQGVLELRQQICKYLAEFRGIYVIPEQVIIGAGSEYLLMLLIQLLGRNRIYALENPCYPKLNNVFKANGANVQPITLDKDGLQIEKLEKTNASVVYLTPSHQFPLGVVMPVARRIKMLKWAEQTGDRYIIEDDYDSEFRYTSRPIPAMKELDHADRVIYLNTFAKSLAPSLRISYMVLPKCLLKKYRDELRFYSSTVPSFEQYTLAKFIKTGMFERHISRIRNLYKSRRDILIELLNKSALAKDMKISGEDAGLHLMLTLKNGLSESEMVELAAQNGVHLHGISDYYIAECEKKPNSTVVLGYAGLNEDIMKKAVICLENAWTKFALCNYDEL